MKRVFPRWSHSPWLVRVLLGMAALAVIALVSLVIYGAQERQRWYSHRDMLRDSAKVALDSMRIAFKAAASSDSAIAVLRKEKAASDSAAARSDRRRAVVVQQNLALRSELADSQVTRTPEDSVWVLMQLVHGQDAIIAEDSIRLQAEKNARAKSEAEAREFQQGRDNALSLLKDSEGLIAKQMRQLDRSEPKCRGCPTRKASYMAGVATGIGLIVGVAVLTR